MHTYPGLARASFDQLYGTDLHNTCYCSKGEQSHDEYLEYHPRAIPAEKATPTTPATAAIPGWDYNDPNWNHGPNYGKNADVFYFGRVLRPTGVKRTRDSAYAEARLMETKDEAYSHIIECYPRDSFLYGDRIRKELDRTFSAPPKAPKYKIEQYNIPPLDLSLPYFISGPSGSGKTGFAKSHFKNPLVLQTLDGLQKLKSGVYDGIVFNDMEFNDPKVRWCLTPAQLINLLDIEEDVEVDCRFKDAMIPAGFPRIFTHNHPPHAVFPKGKDREQKTAIARRFRHLIVTESLFAQQVEESPEGGEESTVEL